MGSCCQLEIKKCSHIDLESLLSPRIQILKPFKTMSDSIREPSDPHYRANSETCTQRNIVVDDEISQFKILEKVIKDYRKSITEANLKKILNPKRLETIKETNSEVSIKKSSTIEQKGIITSSIYFIKGKNSLENTEKYSFETEKDNCDYKTEDINKIMLFDDNKLDEKRIKRKTSYYQTHNSQCSVSIIGLNHDHNNNSGNCHGNCLMENRHEMNSRDKILQHFKLISEDLSLNINENENTFNYIIRPHRITSYKGSLSKFRDVFEDKR